MPSTPPRRPGRTIAGGAEAAPWPGAAALDCPLAPRLAPRPSRGPNRARPAAGGLSPWRRRRSPGSSGPNRARPAAGGVAVAHPAMDWGLRSDDPKV